MVIGKTGYGLQRANIDGRQMRNWFLIVFAIMSCSTSNEGIFVFIGNPPVMFNEVYTANVDYRDDFGEKPGWVEFYNPADTAINLKGYSLTNNASGVLWTFGDAVVLPHSYLTVFLSGRNKPDLNPPSDSVDLIKSSSNNWNWSDDRNSPPGKSTATHAFSKDSITGKITLADNSSTELGWSSAAVMLEFRGGISGTDQILLRGYLEENVNLEIRLAQTGVDDWQGWPAVIKGTGIKNDLYAIDLPLNSAFPDLKKVYGIRFAKVANEFGTVNFSFNSIVAHKKENGIHVSFELNKNGGKLFLLDSLWQVRDSVAYPAETKDLSFAKDFESGKWALSKPPTPNSINSTKETYVSQAQTIAAANIPKSGYFQNELSFTLPSGTDGIIRCDTTGAKPSENSALISGSKLNFAKTAVLRCAQFKDGAYPSEPILRTYIIGGESPSLPVVSIAVDPTDMFDPVVGLYSIGPNASPKEPYYGANYWADTELPVQVDFFENGAKHAWSYPAGVEIFGNYSRMHPKKSVAIGFKAKYGQKTLNYPLFPEHPHLTKFNWFILRNNGNNFRTDYIRDMLMTSLTEGLGIDYQKGRAVIVYYNGKYYGIHNLRERSNEDYFETNYGIDGNYIDLVKGSNEVSNGSDVYYQDILRWLEGVALNDGNLKELEKHIDLDNYTNYMQSEIYFVNKDWPGNNLKRWRSNLVSSKWKWLLYDTDFGFGSTNPKPEVKMLDFATASNSTEYANPPHSTLIIRKLLQNQNYKNAFINRFSLLLATYYSPAKVEARINALMIPIESEIAKDQQRWSLSSSTMSRGLTTIRDFGRNRPVQMQREMEEFFKLSGAVDFTLSVNGNGKILVHNLPVLNENAVFKAYPSVPITIKAVPNAGATFHRWSDGNTNAERTVTVGQVRRLEAEFM
jgi:hypothetical protein